MFSVRMLLEKKRTRWFLRRRYEKEEGRDDEVMLSFTSQVARGMGGE